MSVIELFKEDCNRRQEGVTDFTVNGKCSQCGSCCSNLLPMTGKEVKKIHWYIKKHHISESKHQIPCNDKKLLDLTCPFLDESRPNEKCTIYPVRPQICKCFSCNKEERDKNDMGWAYRIRSTAIAVDMRKEFFK